MATFYQVNFTKQGRDIEETELLYLEGEDIFEVLAALLLELGLDDNEIDIFIKNSLIHYSEERDLITINGEFYNDIANNGLWIYTDLRVSNTGIKRLEQLNVKVEAIYWTTCENLNRNIKTHSDEFRIITPIFTRKHYSDAVHELKKRFKNSFKNTEVE